MSDTRLIVGLGNPGKKYEYTRHNFGFLIASHIAKEYGLKFSRSLTIKGYLAKGRDDLGRFLLLRPATFMNRSGVAVREIIKRNNIDLANILIISDDLSLDFGHLRIRKKGSCGGHNGLESIKDHLKTQEFSRLRVGIGPIKGKRDASYFVLSEFSRKEKKEIGIHVQQAADCCKVWLTHGVTQAMNQFNRRKKDE